ncbi:MAG: hypothetical protein ACE15E_08890 [Acidobacteriota bacterium]
MRLRCFLGRRQLLFVLPIVVVFTGLSLAQTAPSWLSVQGLEKNGATTPLTQYRWIIQEDLTYTGVCTAAEIAASAGIAGYTPCAGKNPGDPKFDPNTNSVSFHKSHMPVVASGCTGFDDLNNTNFPGWEPCTNVWPSGAPVPEGLLPNKRYYISVLNRTNAYSIGGAQFETNASGLPTVSPLVVGLNAGPIPWAQISIFVFEDNHSLNNAPDLPEEVGLPGFKILVEDAGGRYGISAGTMWKDAYDNPLGTTYQFVDLNGNGNHEATEPFVLDANGAPAVQTLGTGIIMTGPDGMATIKYLSPGKYGIQAVPPAGENWQQTSTIEGTKVIDAWVKANEPAFFAEFGPPGFHVFIGFVRPTADPTFFTGGATLKGTVLNNHLSRPPDYAFYNGGRFPHTTPWVGLNDLPVQGGRMVFAGPTANGDFTIPNVPPGAYQLVFWDNNLDLIFAFKDVIVPDGPVGQTVDLGEIPVFQWFARHEHHVFYDTDGDGFPDPGEFGVDPQPGLLEAVVNLRWRDGTIYQSVPTDATGFAPFDQVFPFFAWLVAEVDFVRMQPTGVTVAVDNGGPIDPNDPWSADGQLNPQNQTTPPGPVCVGCVETTKYRTEPGPVLTQANQTFLGQTNQFWWGKRHYADGENGGISGIVFYATVRAEDNPQLAAAEVFEPGIPGVTVNLWAVDPATGLKAGTAPLATTTTDSWDAEPPTGCKYGDYDPNNDGIPDPFVFDPDGPGPAPAVPIDCHDGLRNFNQIRPGVFDGGYAFGPEIDCSAGCPSWAQDVNGDGIGYIIPGEYIVEVVPPPAYQVIRVQDKNVDFGDNYVNPALIPPPCVGTPYLVPDYLTLFPDERVPAAFAGTMQPLCDAKRVTVSGGFNAAADFFLKTDVPIASVGHGFILDDTQNEFDPNSPQFGEKFAPPFVPVSIRDWTGRMIGKTVSDQYGVYNFMSASTATFNRPMFSGVAPQMLTTCMNDPGADPLLFNPKYSTFCYNFQYMPGTTTYLDTPVLPVGAHVGPNQFPLDCEFPDGTPRIHSVDVTSNSVGGGPYIPSDSKGVTGAQTIVINAVGAVAVANPKYCDAAANTTCPPESVGQPPTIQRDYGFGNTAGTVKIGNLTIPAGNVIWGAGQITVNLPSTNFGTVGGQQLTVIRSNGLQTITGVTIQIGLRPGATVRRVTPTGNPLGGDIQSAIDVAGPNDLILVQPGEYKESVIMYKPVQLQGWGEGSTTINAVKIPTEKLQAWRNKVEQLITNGSITLLPGQEALFGGIEPAALASEEGAGVLVAATTSNKKPDARFDTKSNQGARVDGFTIRGADTGGGVIANGYTPYLEISNNRIQNNSGFFSGGIRVGHPTLTDDGLEYTDAHNDFIKIHHNHIRENGGIGGFGGGVTMCTGSDSYLISQNYICGNFSGGGGGGIAHVGLSPVSEKGKDIPTIQDNVVIFNESFNQGQTVSGGGISIAGATPLVPGGLTDGSGSVLINRNILHANSAQAGDGGGIRLALINGADVAKAKNNKSKWHSIELFNNVITNNVAGLAGGGISLSDATNVTMVHNSIANNDSTATAGAAFTPGNPNQSVPQPAGIASYKHSAALAAVLPNSEAGYSNPLMANNIVTNQRSFFFQVGDGTPGSPYDPGVFGLCQTGTPDPAGDALVCPFVATPPQMGVIGMAGTLTCTNCLTTGDPFVRSYYNGSRSSVVLQPEITTGIQAAPAFDEGGNFIRLRFGPLTLFNDLALNDGDPGTPFGDYHLLGPSGVNCVSCANLAGTYPSLSFDFEGQARPSPSDTRVDQGADEVHP